MIIDYASMGMRIRNRRKKMKKSQEDVADLCNISTSFVGHIERGTRKASIETLANLSEALGSSLDYFVTGFEIESTIPARYENLLKRAVGVLCDHLDEWTE